MELNDTYDLEMLKSDLKSIAAEYKAGDVALQYIAQLEAEINRAMDAMFPNGWKPDDAMALGQTVEGMCEQLDKAVAWFEGDDSPRARLEAEVAKWEKIANEEHAQSAHIAMRNGELQAENERLREMQHRIAGEISYTKEINEKRGHEMPDVMDRWVDALKAGDDDVAG